MTYINPLDLQTMLVGTLSGSWAIFLFLAVIVISIFAARFRMNNIMFFMMLSLFAVFMASWIPWFYALMLILMSALIFFIIAKLIKN